MADNDNTPIKIVPPPCSKCGGATRFYKRVPDLEKGITYELFDCAVCGLTTARRSPKN
jgi:hypothetical protein